MGNGKQPPEKTFRIGYVSASIFKRTVESPNGGAKRTLRSVTLQKSYLSGDGNRQYTNSFDLAELPQAGEVLRLALNYVAEHEADVSP